MSPVVVVAVAAAGVVGLLLGIRWVRSTVRDIYRAGHEAGYQEAMRDFIADQMVREREAAAHAQRQFAAGDYDPATRGESVSPRH